MSILLSIPAVQNNLAQRATKYLSKKYNTSIVIDKIDISNLKDIKLLGIVIKDHHDFPFIKVKSLKTSLFNAKKIIDNKVELGSATMVGFDFVMKKYKGELHDNFSVFSHKFDHTKDPNKPYVPFILTSSSILLQNSSFYLYDENKQDKPIVFYNNINGIVDDFELHGRNIYGTISKVNLIDNYGIAVTDFSTNFTYTPTKMLFETTSLKTKSSVIKTDMVFKYKEGDLSDFNNKVQIEAKITKADVSLADLYHFYDELGKNDVIHFTTTLKGTLNDFDLENLKLVSDNNSVINGNLHFTNAVNRENGFALKSDLTNLTSDYDNLVALLPNLLGKTLPKNFKMFGRFKLKGQSFITTKKVDAQLTIDSKLGTSISNLLITNIDDIENANYTGKIELVDYELGKIIKDSLVGNFSMVADVTGKGFTLENLNTSLKGHISKHQYKGYTYSDIAVNGVFKDKHFNGEMFANDKNLKMNFKGLADLSSAIYNFKFKADVGYANFNKLNLFTKHKKSILMGKIDFDVHGNSINNMVGSIRFKDAKYENQKDTYVFKNFDITSNFKDSIRTLRVNSKDIISGKIRGKFKFEELAKLTRNSLASMYTHYQPDSVSSGQFLDFNFKIYDKIIGVFFPEVIVGKNTWIKGEINADDTKFELTFKSPKIEAYKNVIEKIRLQIDNKNPLYNTLFSIKNIDSKYYNVKDFNLVNVTLNDTLFLQTDFIGGKKQTEKYNLSLFHTINADNKSVIGFKKSNLEFKNQKWLINPKNNSDSKVVFDYLLQSFDFKPLLIQSGTQEMEFYGKISDAKNKDLHFNFKEIFLDKITPRIDSIRLDGIVNGKFNYKIDNGKTIPKIDLIVNDFTVNNLHQGDLIVKAQSDKTFKKYDFRASIEKDAIKNLDVFGLVDLSKKNATIDANLVVKDLHLEPLSPLGGENITNIRGVISGSTKLTGLLRNPDMKGELFLRDAGLNFPYLNVDYHLKEQQKVTVYDQTFDFNTTRIVDSEMQTEALLTGTITHTNFKKWFLDLNIDSDNLLVLNTKEKEETLYYGSVLINGGGTIKGFTDELTIDVSAITNPKTEFIVPLSDINTIEENSLVHFVSDKDEKIDLDRPDEIVFEQKGLTLNIFLQVTPDALAGMVIDKSTGSYLSGRGNAFLDIGIKTTGKFEMYGTYVVDEGKYVLKNIVNKEFDVQKNGKIYWNGSPFDAFLDIVAINKVKANPSIILENIQGSRDIDVDLITKITGNLYSPKMAFDVSLPKASSVVKSELNFKLNDEDKKMTQFFSLLGFGTFTDVENADFANSGNSLIAGTLSQKLTGVINNLLRDKDEKFQIGFNLELGDQNRLNNLRTDDQVGVTLKTKIFKKITLNGVVGVPINSNSQSGVTGEIEAELPLNKKETFKAKMYNRRNEIEFDALDNEGYTQGLGLSYQFNFDDGKEFLEKVGLRKTKEQREKLKQKKLLEKKRKDSLRQVKKENFVNFTTSKKDTIR